MPMPNFWINGMLCAFQLEVQISI